MPNQPISGPLHRDFASAYKRLERLRQLGVATYTARQHEVERERASGEGVGSSAHAWELAKAVAARHARTPSDRQELLGEAGLALAECAQRYEHDRGCTLSTYAWQRMQGRARDAIYAEFRRATTHATYRRELQETRFNTAPLSASVDIHGALKASADRFDTKDRLILNRRYWRDQSFADIADELKWSPDKTRRRHTVLLGKLRHTLGLVRSNPASSSGSKWREGAQIAARASQKRGKITSMRHDLPEIPGSLKKER